MSKASKQTSTMCVEVLTPRSYGPHKRQRVKQANEGRGHSVSLGIHELGALGRLPIEAPGIDQNEMTHSSRVTQSLTQVPQTKIELYIELHV